MRILFHFRSDISHRLPFAGASCLAETHEVLLLPFSFPDLRFVSFLVVSHLTRTPVFPLFITLESLFTSLGCLPTKIDSEAFSQAVQSRVPHVFLSLNIFKHCDILLNISVYLSIYVQSLTIIISYS